MAEEVKFPSMQEIKDKQKLLDSEIVKTTSALNPTQEFLNAIKPSIVKAVKSGNSLTKITQGINKVYGTRISVITLTKFCKKNNITSK